MGQAAYALPEGVDIREVAALAETVAQAQARRSYWAYRQYMDPKLKKGWWQRKIAHKLQQFWADYKTGRRPVLAIVAPPQHGKSRQVVEFISWIAGLDPDIQTIYGSYSDKLGKRANADLQRMMLSPRYMNLFQETRIGGRNVVSGLNWKRNSEHLQFVDRGGSFRNTTVLGGVTGESLDLGIVDDPLKGRKEARSATIRDSTWEWLTDDFFTRFSEHAGLLIIMTRWHHDDPLGRMEEMRDAFPQLEIVRDAAIAEEDDEFRLAGDALFPEHKSIEFLNTRKIVMGTARFSAVYQGRPTPEEGSLFPIELIVELQQMPVSGLIAETVRYWDKAGTRGDGAYTSGVRMHRLRDGRFLVSHVYREQVDVWTRERKIKELAAQDEQQFPNHCIYVEQEPGSGGKESAQRTVAMLAGYRAYADRPVGDKELRAEPFAAQVQAGTVSVLDREWTRDYLDELDVFPEGKYMDQVDASSGAFAMLAGYGDGRAGMLF